MTPETDTPQPGGPAAVGGRAIVRFLGVRGLPTLVVSLAVALVCVEMLYLVVAELGVRLVGPSLFAVDAMVALWVHSLEAPILTATFLGLTFLGTSRAMVVQIAIATLLLAATRRVLLAWALLVTMVGEVVLEHVTKDIVQRARPELFRLDEATGYSFPSGHALASVCFYGFLAFVLWSRRRSLPGALWPIAIAAALALGIGTSRIYLGVHYPSDVLGGWLGGAIWLACVIGVLRRLARQTEVAGNPDASSLT